MRAIIFDFDGVIHDTLEDLHRIHCQTLEELTMDEMKENVFGGNSREYFDKFSDEEKDNFEKIWKTHCNDLRLERAIRDELEILSQSYLLFIVSSNNEYNLNRYFENNNFLNIFTKIYGAETHKSKYEKFKILLGNFDLIVDECIFVTDTLGDILEANKIGLKTIAVDFGYHERERLEKGNPIKIVSHFKEIGKFIES
ncbi:MAG: HAD family hydrolase [Candidatus Nanoarchaeia archaeon]